MYPTTPSSFSASPRAKSVNFMRKIMRIISFRNLRSGKRVDGRSKKFTQKHPHDMIWATRMTHMIC